MKRYELQAIIQEATKIIDINDLYCIDLEYNNYTNKGFEINLRNGGGYIIDSYSDKKLKNALNDFLAAYNLTLKQLINL